MTAAGWHADPTANLGVGDGVVGHFRYPLNQDFAVTAWLPGWAKSPRFRWTQPSASRISGRTVSGHTS
jgi:hypothetical protein